MIAAPVTGSPITGPGTRRPARRLARPGATHRRPDPSATDAEPADDPRPRAAGFDAPLGDRTPPPAAALASEAARGFSAGNGYLTGQIVDRHA